MTSKEELVPLLEIQPPAILALAQAVRDLLKAIQPETVEDASIKLGVIYYKHNGVVCAMTMHKEHIDLHFYKGVQLADPLGLLQGGGKGLRHLKFTRLDEITRAVLEPFVRQAFQLNRAKR